MIYRILVGFFCLLCIDARAQVLRDLNYNYIYPNAIFAFDWKVVKKGDDFKVFYEVRESESKQNTSFSVSFETRTSLSEKTGISVTSSTESTQSGILMGSTDFQAKQDQKIIVAK